MTTESAQPDLSAIDPMAHRLRELEEAEQARRAEQEAERAEHARRRADFEARIMAIVSPRVAEAAHIRRELRRAHNELGVLLQDLDANPTPETLFSGEFLDQLRYCHRRFDLALTSAKSIRELAGYMITDAEEAAASTTTTVPS